MTIEDKEQVAILKDVEITISLRSRQTDLRCLTKLMKSIDLSNLSIDTKIVLTESEAKVKSSPQGELTVLRHRYIIV